AANRITVANLEAGDRFAGQGRHRLLAGNLGHVANRVLENLLVTHRLTDTHVQGDLGDTGHFHHGLVTELLLERRRYIVLVNLLQASHRHSLGVHQLAVRLEEADLAAIFKRLDPDTFTLLGGGIEQRDVRHMDRHLFLDDATHFTLQRVRAHVLLHTIHTLYHDALIINAAQHGTATAAILARQHQNLITLADLVHLSTPQSTSGASETIFMNRSVRSSRVTGPKM